MTILVLIVIYLVFVGLGLPINLLGTAWPLMQPDLAAPFTGVGIMTMVLSGSMVVTSFLSGKLIHRWGHAKVILVSVGANMVALLLFWQLKSFSWMYAAAVILGLGSGAIDATCNHYISAHYRSSHMNWLHCSWGIGAAGGPLIMSQFLSKAQAWRGGFLSVGIILACVFVAVVCSMRFWKKQERLPQETKTAKPALELIKLPGVKATLVLFICYCFMEAGVGVWGSSYLVANKGIAADVAAAWVSGYFWGITAGRLISGFAALKLSNKWIIRIGISCAALGAVLIIAPLPAFCTLIGLILIGVGGAPIVPCMLQETPHRYGEAQAQHIIGFQMAAVFAGGTIAPSAIGQAAALLGTSVLPMILALCIVGTVIVSEYINRRTASRAARAALAPPNL